MTGRLLPSDFDASLSLAVRNFWATRSSGTSTQGGTRGNVIAGKNLDGFLAVVQAVAKHSRTRGSRRRVDPRWVCSRSMLRAQPPSAMPLNVPCHSRTALEVAEASGSFTATSSPSTSWSRATATSGCSTSGSHDTLTSSRSRPRRCRQDCNPNRVAVLP